MKNEEMALLFSEATLTSRNTMARPWSSNTAATHDQRDAEERVMNDLVTLTLLGVRVVLVHGGGPAINEMLKKSAWRAFQQRSACDR